MSSAPDRRRGGVAFLLAQLGHHAAERFSERIAALDLTPPHAGILRAIAAAPGRSQQALSTELQLLPSRVVAHVAGLEDRGSGERPPTPDDRRQYALYLPAARHPSIQNPSPLDPQPHLPFPTRRHT